MTPECETTSQTRTPTCNGTAISPATNPDIPRKQLLVATALDDRPTLASTMYVKELAYIHLSAHEGSNDDEKDDGVMTHIEKNPHRKSITQIAEICTCCWQTQAYPITAGGKNHMASLVLSNLIYDTTVGTIPEPPTKCTTLTSG